MPKSKKSKKNYIRKSSNKDGRSFKIDAISVRRNTETVQIPIGKISIPDWMRGEDPIFLGLYKKFLTGKISGFVTRVPLDSILEGFFLASRKFEYICDKPTEDVIEWLMLQIRQGARPSIYLYHNPKPNSEKRFLCPDDVAVSFAYRRLGIKSVPAIVFAPGKRTLPHSSLEARVHSSAINLGPRICALVSAEKPQKILSVLGEKLPSEASQSIQILLSALSTLVARLRLFHAPKSNQLHYHHMIFSAVIRAQETLRAIELLVEKNLWYQALALLRVLYEIHVNFFFDWLQPETNYRFLAAAAVLNVAKAKSEMVKELIDKGTPKVSADEQANIVWKPVNFASTVAEKARLPKVGILYHSDIYSFLSQISHQDFEVASLHANRFDDEKFLTIDDEIKETYLRFMDYIVAEFLTCVSEDIGTVL
jgi:Family of unknown function (DUF5677)